jgi:hypothetical protein
MHFLRAFGTGSHNRFAVHHPSVIVDLEFPAALGAVDLSAVTEMNFLLAFWTHSYNRFTSDYVAIIVVIEVVV